MFTVISVIALLILWAGLACRRHRAELPRDKRTPWRAGALRPYFAWLSGCFKRALKKPDPRRWATWGKDLPLWRLPFFEKWLYVVFIACFLYLAGSGLFFAFFIPRGFFGYPLLLHITAGAFFAVCLVLIALTKAGEFRPGFERVPADIRDWDPRRWKIGLKSARGCFFWLLVLSSFAVTVSAVLPMFPLLGTTGQVLMLDIHRYAGLVSLLFGIAFADLTVYSAKKS